MQTPPPIPSLPPSGFGPMPSRAIPVPSPQPRRWALILGISGLVLAVCIGGGIMAWHIAKQRELPPLLSETDADKYAEASAAYTHADAAANDPNLRGIHDLFVRLGKARAAGDANALIDCYDADRQISEVERRGFIQLTSAERPSFVTGFRKGLSNKLAKMGSTTAWRKFDICHVRFLPGGREAVVYLREMRQTGIEVKLRYWVRREGATWRIYDIEDLQGGLRDTTQIGKAMADTIAAGGKTPPWISAHQTIEMALSRIYQGNLDSAESALKSVETTPMPPTLDVQRRIALASLHIQRRRYQDVISDLAPVDSGQTGAALIEELRAEAFNGLGQREEALASVQKYLDEAGEGGPIELQRGRALAGLKRTSEAAAAFRRGLDDEPDSRENLDGLRRVLPASQKAEIGQRLARASDPKALFDHVAREATIASDIDALQALVDAYASHGDDPLLAYYQAILLGHKKEYRQAADLFLATYPRAAAIDHPAISRQFVLNMLNDGDPMGAYAKAPEPEPAFKKVAGWLLSKHDSATLQKVLERRRADAPADAWISYYQASLLESSKQYAAAAGSFFSAMDAATDRTDKTTFRAAAVRASYFAGAGLDAFRRLRTKEAFAELASLYASYHDAGGLEKLLAEEANRTGRDAMDVAYWNAKLAYLRGDFQSAVDTLSAAYPESERKPGSNYRESDLLIRSLTRAGQFDAAMQQARRWSRTGDAGPWYVALIEANRGNVKEAAAAIDLFLKQDPDYTVADLYRDSDLRVALNAPAFAQWRQTHSEAAGAKPATRPAAAVP